MKEYFYEMVEKAKKEFQIDAKEEDIKNIENKIFGSNLSDEQIKQRIDLAYSTIKENYEKRKMDAEIKSGLKEGNIKQVRQTAKFVFSDPFLRDKLSVYGGSVPYLLTGMDSKRVIGDIDTHVELERMPDIRKYVYNHPDTISILYDSLELTGEDFGMELIINGLRVSIFPTIAKEEGMAIRTFYTREVSGEVELKETLFPGIIEKDEIKTYDIDGVKMRIISPEFTYLTKEVANRQKDIDDNKILINVVNPIDLDRMRKQMKTPIVTYDKILPLQKKTDRSL